jgi:hypothetical protein
LAPGRRLFGKADAVVYDEEIPGFGIRMRAGGSRVLFFQYRVGRKRSRRFTFGKATAEMFGTVKDKATGAILKLCVRDQAQNMPAQVRLGNDPAAEKAAKVEAGSRPQADAFKDVVDLYLAHQEKSARARTIVEEWRYLNRRPRACTRCR